MTTTSKIRIATADTTNACTLACSEITAAVGLPVHPEFQEIEGDCLILELRLGSELHSSPAETPGRSRRQWCAGCRGAERLE